MLPFSQRKKKGCWSQSTSLDIDDSPAPKMIVCDFTDWLQMKQVPSFWHEIKIMKKGQRSERLELPLCVCLSCVPFQKPEFCARNKHSHEQYKENTEITLKGLQWLNAFAKHKIVHNCSNGKVHF